MLRGDARKRLARANHTAPIRVFRSRYGSWETRCDDTCDWPLDLTCVYWQDAYEAAIGHACLRHRRGAA